MTSGSRLREVENNQYAQMIIVSGNPNGVVAAAQATFAWDDTAKILYINTDGSTTWVVV